MLRTGGAVPSRNDGNECAVLVSKSTADYQGGTGFPAMPKSISQTSPRRGVAILFLKGLEQGVGGSADFLAFQGSGIERQGTAQHLFRKGALLFHGEMFEGVQQCFSISAHEDIIPAHPPAMTGVKPKLTPFAAFGLALVMRSLGNPLECWRPRRDLNPRYRRERAMS